MERAAGALDPALLAFGAAQGHFGQFVLTYDSESDISTLVWDHDGDDPSGAVEIYAILEGTMALNSSDILIL